MFRSELAQALKAMDLSVSESQLAQFCTFDEALVETNKVMNLTAITDPKGVAIKHMADSLSCYDPAYFKDGASVLDLGTGAGFPGLPLLIYRPDLKVTFFDSLQKRLTFLEKVVCDLGLTASFLHGRAEEMAHKPEYRSAFDIVTSRAVARLNILAEWALPYVRTGGYFISLKGAQYEEELAEGEKALQILGGKVAEVRPVRLPGLDDVRRLNPLIIPQKRIKAKPQENIPASQRIGCEKSLIEKVKVYAMSLKKILCLAAAACLTVSAAVFADTPQPPEISAHAAYVMDADTGDTLYAKKCR